MVLGAARPAEARVEELERAALTAEAAHAARAAEVEAALQSKLATEQVMIDNSRDRK